MIAVINAIPSLLNYGLLGLAALIVFLFWRLISAEQERDGQPRKGIIRMSWLFIGLSVLLAAAAMSIELSGAPYVKLENKDLKNTNQQLSERSQELERKVARLEERDRSQNALIERLDEQIKQLSVVFSQMKSSYANSLLQHVQNPATGLPQPMTSSNNALRQTESKFSKILEDAKKNLDRSFELRSSPIN